MAEIHLDTIPTDSTIPERISFSCNSVDLQVSQQFHVFFILTGFEKKYLVLVLIE